jgi:hypothetical protein
LALARLLGGRPAIAAPPLDAVERLVPAVLVGCPPPVRTAPPPAAAALLSAATKLPSAITPLAKNRVATRDVQTIRMLFSNRINRPPGESAVAVRIASFAGYLLQGASVRMYRFGGRAT